MADGDGGSVKEDREEVWALYRLRDNSFDEQGYRGKFFLKNILLIIYK